MTILVKRGKRKMRGKDGKKGDVVSSLNLRALKPRTKNVRAWLHKALKGRRCMIAAESRYRSNHDALRVDGANIR